MDGWSGGCECGWGNGDDGMIGGGVEQEGMLICVDGIELGCLLD